MKHLNHKLYLHIQQQWQLGNGKWPKSTYVPYMYKYIYSINNPGHSIYLDNRMIMQFQIVHNLKFTELIPFGENEENGKWENIGKHTIGMFEIKLFWLFSCLWQQYYYYLISKWIRTPYTISHLNWSHPTIDYVFRFSWSLVMV